MPDNIIPVQPNLSGSSTVNQPVNISIFVELADTIQESSFETDTQFYLASTLYRSLENFAAALSAKDMPPRDRVYCFAYDAYHLANALNEQCTEKPEGLAEILIQIERVMIVHKAGYVEVTS